MYLRVRCVRYFATTELSFVFCWRAVLIPVLLQGCGGRGTGTKSCGAFDRLFRVLITWGFQACNLIAKPSQQLTE